MANNFKEKHMLHKKNVFLKILCIEFEDLEEDINMLIEEYTDKHRNEEISHYVFLENLAVLKNELFGVESFYEYIKFIEPRDYGSLHDLMSMILSKLKIRVKQNGIVPSVVIIIERKMKKVAKYVEQSRV